MQQNSNSNSNRVVEEECVRARMEEIRLKCEREIDRQEQKSESAINAFHKSLGSAKSLALTTLLNHEKLGNLKTELRAVEDDLVKVLAVKTRKEAKRMAIVDSIASTKARIQQLEKVVEHQKSKKDEFAAIISQQSSALSACEEKHDNDSECRGEVEEAISWYNRVLGFRIECGHGIKFIFTDINVKNPKEEFSFTIRHENDVYSLLDCDPQLDDTKELILELNRSNGLFKFVRTMRERFQKASAGILHGKSIEPDVSMISASAPVSSVSTDSRNESPAKGKALHSEDADRLPKKANHGGPQVSDILSPGSSSSVRRSARLKVRK